MNKNKEQWIDEVMQSSTGMARTNCPDLAEMAPITASRLSITPFRLPVWSLAAAVLWLVLNVATLTFALTQNGRATTQTNATTAPNFFETTSYSY